MHALNELIAQIETNAGDELKQVDHLDTEALSRAYDAISYLMRSKPAVASILSAAGISYEELGELAAALCIAMLAVDKHVSRRTENDYREEASK